MSESSSSHRSRLQFDSGPVGADLSFEPLTPTAFLARSAIVHSDRLAVVDGSRQLSYRELRDRVSRLAGALQGVGVKGGERVAVLGANSRLMLEAHYGVPLAGAVLVALNMRLSAQELGYILDHCAPVCSCAMLNWSRWRWRRAPQPPGSPW